MHRDIKPENIMFGKQSTIKLIDWGFATIQEDKSTEKLELAGTPYYIAPEVIDKKAKGHYGKECDIWSLGVVLYQLLNNDEMPFDGNNI
jgi:serine/threonine protein kinase